MKISEISTIFKKRPLVREVRIIEVEEYDDITDEIEKSLLQIKDDLNLSEEEINTRLEEFKKLTQFKIALK